MLCIACNSKVPASIKICSCGHVFSPESQRILGKRFSVYRIGRKRRSSGLSERQSNSDVKLEPTSPKKKKTIMFRTSPQSKKPKDSPIKRLSHVKKKTSKKRRRFQVLKENLSGKSKTERQLMVQTSPQKTLRLSLALAEINRRICGQTLLWRMLSP
ncbi:UPF0547 protein C16orf87 homolog [Exaiptasia diaphana]|uniref:Uncharacterized protein n=1 Tax=Exaiptasia diaphana TaxID=2652724 RepID=A0A913XZR0_EXADI|nr:UPF0547 protein C16orf87 homolog [Exaiptasia diaphana]KXJ23677.1 hypothetical protein AC249_AIPGENE20577 [Exaiptasia diaphana]